MRALDRNAGSIYQCVVVVVARSRFDHTTSSSSTIMHESMINNHHMCGVCVCFVLGARIAFIIMHFAIPVEEFSDLQPDIRRVPLPMQCGPQRRIACVKNDEICMICRSAAEQELLAMPHNAQCIVHAVRRFSPGELRKSRKK